MQLDDKDRAILRALQRDGRLAMSDLAETVGLTPSPCWRRVKQMEKEGIIRRYVAVLDAAELGLGLLAYAHVCLDNQHLDNVRSFDELIERCDEVLESCATSGEYDYLLKVRVADMAAYEHFLRQTLLQHPGIRSVNTSFVMSQRKSTTVLPV